MVSTIDLHIAKQKMQLRSTNFCLSFVSTLWRGEVVMCCFNNLSCEMADIFCSQKLTAEDVITLENLIKEFIHKE